MTELTVNGVKHTVSESTTVTQLLETLKIVPERVVVEVNLTILKRAEHPTTTLKDGDQVEIVHFVGGGCLQTVQGSGLWAVGTCPEPRTPNPELRHG